MPKRREELRKISLAEREYAIIDAIRKNGMASIEDVVKSLISRFELDLTDSNAKAALTKSVRIYLQKSAENGDMLGRAYFRKGKGDPEKIPNEDLERDERGKVKNKYNIKYFLRGSNHHVPGGNLIIESGGLFFPHANSNGDFSAEWQISRFQKVKPHHFHFVFKGSYGHYLALSAPTSDAPFSLIIGRAVMGQKPFLQVSDLDERFKRPSILLLDESSVSSPKGVDQATRSS